MLSRRQLLGAPAALLAGGGGAPRVVRTAPENEASIIATDDGMLRLFYMVRGRHVASISSSNSGRTWNAPRIEFPVSGATAHACVALHDRNGAIHVFFLQRYARGPPFGCNDVTSVCSHDSGETWELSPSRLRAPCYDGYNGSNYGAVEPCVAEMTGGRLWMLIRTQTGTLYESFSRDRLDWQDARPSRFRSSNSPAALLRL